MSAGIRPSVAMGVAATLLLSAALGWVVAGGGATSESRPAAKSPPAPRRFDPDPDRPAGVRFAGRLLELPEPGLRAQRAAPPIPAPQAPEERRPAEPRSGELVGLEREAAQQADAASLVDPEVVEKALAAIPRPPGEGDEELRRRLAEERERLLSREFLVQYRLAQLFQSTEYPPGFDLERDVVGPERQRVAELPAQDRATEIRNALESWEPGRAEPRFEGAPDPALAWQIGQPGL